MTPSSTTEASAALSTRTRHFLSAPSAEILTTFPPSTPRLSIRTSIPFRPWSPFPTPHQRTNIGPRLDYAITKNNTLTARYQYYRDTETNYGIGQISCLRRLTIRLTTEHTMQIGDTQVFGSKVVNETRFQYLRDNTSDTSIDTNPAANVFGAFTGGGNGTDQRRPPGSLRTAELHFGDSRQSHHQVWRPLARVARR